MKKKWLYILVYHYIQYIYFAWMLYAFFPNFFQQALQRKAGPCISVCHGHHRQHVWGDHCCTPPGHFHHPEPSQQPWAARHLCACTFSWPRWGWPDIVYVKELLYALAAFRGGGKSRVTASLRGNGHKAHHWNFWMCNHSQCMERGIPQNIIHIHHHSLHKQLWCRIPCIHTDYYYCSLSGNSDSFRLFLHWMQGNLKLQSSHFWECCNIFDKWNDYVFMQSTGREQKAFIVIEQNSVKSEALPLISVIKDREMKRTTSAKQHVLK